MPLVSQPEDGLYLLLLVHALLTTYALAVKYHVPSFITSISPCVNFSLTIDG